MATETTGTASACVGPDGSAIGMPQLCADWMPNQIFWLLLTLVAIYFVLSRVALPRIATVLAERQGTITNDLAAAEDLKQKAVEAEEAYNKALADARAESEKAISEIRASAVQSVEAVAKDTAGSIVAALGGAADDATVAAAVDAQMKG